MKKRLSILLAVILLLSCMLMAVPTAHAEKATEKRAIAIVYDNSGSMYMKKNLAWCRATYAMEVFASMLNEGDILQIYPMNPFTLGKGGTKVYSMEKPLEISSKNKDIKASDIRENFIADNGITPLKSIGYAAEGLRDVTDVKVENKYLIILTDGNKFHIDGGNIYGEEPSKTQELIEQEIIKYAGNGMTVMYLGMNTVNSEGKVTVEACDPFTGNSKNKDKEPKNNYVKEIATQSIDVISSLTKMCNLIFGRNTLPKDTKYFINGGNQIFLDVSTKKLIVFVQGTNIGDLKVTGDDDSSIIFDKASESQVKYPENGAEHPDLGVIVSDPNLQGMMVTYDGSTAGTFNINYDGEASSIEVYYEPDVEMMFKFTDAETNAPVNPEELYEGEYKLEYGMVDAKSGKFVESPLLGMPEYTGSYTISDADGENPKTITFGPEKGFKGSKLISLKMNEIFEAELEVDYLNGYKIRKTSDDFGWGKIIIKEKEVKDYWLEITGGQDSYPLQQLGKGKSYEARVYYENKPLPPEAYSEKIGDKYNVNLELNGDSGNADVEIIRKDDHFEIKLKYKNSDAQSTVCGESTANFKVTYTPPKSKATDAYASIKYNIKDDSVDLGVKLDISDDYIVIKDMAEAQPIIVNFTLNGAPVTAEDFKKIELILPIDCGGIKYEEPVRDEANSAYKIKLLETKGIDEGKYIINVNAQYTDSIGRVAKTEAESLITLSALPIWVKWVITISILLILFIIIWTILHIRVLPTKAHTTKKLSFMSYDSDDVTRSANFLAEIKQGGAKFQTQYGGRKYGITMEVTPGKESYLYKGQKRRSAEVSVASVRKFGPAKIQEAMIGSAKYVLDDDTGKLVPALPNMKPFPIKNGMMVKFSGSIQDAGVDKDFEVTSKINFKK